MKGAFKWLSLHPSFLTGFAVGVLVGVIFLLPLWPWQLPDSHASLIGAAFGAILAVGGAAWYTDVAHQRELDLARADLVGNLTMLADGTETLRSLCLEWIDGGHPDSGTAMVAHGINLYEELFHGARRRAKELRGEFMRLGTKGATAYSDSKPVMKRLRAFATRISTTRGISDYNPTMQYCLHVVREQDAIAWEITKLRAAIKVLQS